MNRLRRDQQARVVAALVEGSGIRATVRMSGVAKNTVVKLLTDLGAAWVAYHDRNVRGLRVRRIQCDEIWSFGQLSSRRSGRRMGSEFMQDCADRIHGRVQITTDGHQHPYP